MDMRKLVGQNVRRIRQKMGLTQEEFADVSGFSQQYISSLEQGRRNPTVITLYELASNSFGLGQATKEKIYWKIALTRRRPFSWNG